MIEREQKEVEMRDVDATCIVVHFAIGCVLDKNEVGGLHQLERHHETMADRGEQTFKLCRAGRL